MQTLAQIIRSLFILTLIGALTYRFTLTLFFIYYHNQYIKYEPTTPAIIYLLTSYGISIIGLAVLYNKIYDIEKKCHTLCAKLVGLCYALAGITFGSAFYGSVLKLMKLDQKINSIILPSNKLNYGFQYGSNEQNILRWYQVSFTISLVVFCFSSLIISTDLVFKGFDKMRHRMIDKIRPK